MPQECAHGLGRVDIHSKVAAPDLAPRIPERHEQPHIPAVARDAEAERVPRAGGGQRQECGKIGIAADHPIQRDDVGWLERGGHGPGIKRTRFSREGERER